MSSSGIVGVALLGAGLFVKEAHLPALAPLTDSAVLKAVYSRSSKSATDVATSAKEILKLPNPPDVYCDDGKDGKDLDALFRREDITCIVIALPITLQPSIILKAFRAGKHVLSEKPVAPDVAQGLDLISAYRNEYEPRGIIWRVAENFEAEPGFRAAGEAIKAGKIGRRVCFFDASVINYIDKSSKWYNTAWRTVPDYQGGFLLDGGVHTIAALRTILPQPITHLSGFASLNKDYLAPHDTISTILSSESNFQGTLAMTFAHPIKPSPAVDAFLVVGDEGWLSVNFYPPSAPHSKDGLKTPTIIRTIITTAGEDADSQEAKTETIDHLKQGVEVEFESFFAKVSGKKTLDIGDPSQALFDVAFIQAALNSGGELVDLRKLVQLGS